ncbi:RNA 2',3'-cyclic phosphodiesterase [Streptomyces sp. G-G2]|uniref:RNA 2',3'-cyclic phosphodiesterase n=1 Tax=Streptomyces sp. G-G2 TaxID=3046201 RepID=UPI0024B9EE08|nr:RNA 2',3'-cyclic phosphodiesterase [Streptomyces sp. G-G2]MDJ0384596.1 RNA 2',3'-cyclic phosphodiesterase [Streptomyces sp. G-G2]
MRLFAAVLPPAGAVGELRGVVQGLPAAPGVRWTAESGWHYTLAFMGEVGEDLLPDLLARLARAAARTEPFTLRVHGSGHFGDRALWVGAAGGLDALRMLAERADAAARRAGVPMEQHHRYTPHLTLARAKEGAADLRPYAEALAGFEGGPWPVRELSLVRSDLDPVGGPRYDVVGAWPIGG